MNKVDLNHIVKREIGDKILLVDIKQNAVYEIDQFVASCVDLIKKNGGVVDYLKLTKSLNKETDMLKQVIPSLLRNLCEGGS